jgi:Ser/Thr protein kinase RdoA (MazF antagonist)
VTPLRSAEHLVGKRWKREFTAFKSALIDGYLKEMDWDDHDEEILSYLMPTRGLVMLGWLNSRSDNPDVRKYFKHSARRVVKKLQKFARAGNAYSSIHSLFFLEVFSHYDNH